MGLPQSSFKSKSFFFGLLAHVGFGALEIIEGELGDQIGGVQVLGENAFTDDDATVQNQLRTKQTPLVTKAVSITRPIKRGANLKRDC